MTSLYRMTNGVGRPVADDNSAILTEASFDEGVTGLVICTMVDTGDEITFSQHENGEWCVGLNDDPVEGYDLDDRNEAFRVWMETISDVRNRAVLAATRL